MVVWITGLSGAGKSVLGREVVRLARERVPNTVLLDGDLVRQALGNDLGHDLRSRRRNADRICGLGKMLDDQGIHVVCAILSLFPESREWNRENLRGYYEVFIEVPLDELIRRDAKGLYGRAFAGDIELPGVNLPFPPPDAPDLTIVNTGGLGDLLAHAPALAAVIRGEGG